MRRYRLSDDAKADIAVILRRSEAVHGPAARIRYRGLITGTFRRIAADPEGPPTLDRSALAPGLRSMHTLYGRDWSREARVASPVHAIYFKLIDVQIVAIVRVLHEGMDPSRHLTDP